MYKFKDVLILPSGVPITSGDITVRDSATEVAVTVYEDDETTPISQPFSPDNEGNVVFKAPNGVYDILLNGAVERDEIVFFDFGDTTTFSNGTLNIGVNDTTAGLINLYGPGTGVTQGGRVILYVGADYDTTFNYFAVDVTNDNFRIGRQGIPSDLIIDAGGILHFGTHTAIGAETVTGYITIKDSGGTSRKIAVVS